MEDKNLFILHDEHHGYWWTGDTRSQVISRHCIDKIIPGHSSFSTRWVKPSQVSLICLHQLVVIISNWRQNIVRNVWYRYKSKIFIRWKNISTFFHAPIVSNMWSLEYLSCQNKYQETLETRTNINIGSSAVAISIVTKNVAIYISWWDKSWRISPCTDWAEFCYKGAALASIHKLLETDWMPTQYCDYWCPGAKFTLCPYNAQLWVYT